MLDGHVTAVLDFKNDFFFVRRWEFKTFNHDIRFGVKRKNDLTGDVSNEIELARVASHQLDEEGFITCLPDCTCKSIEMFRIK